MGEEPEKSPNDSSETDNTFTHTNEEVNDQNRDFRNSIKRENSFEDNTTASTTNSQSNGSYAKKRKIINNSDEKSGDQSA